LFGYLSDIRSGETHFPERQKAFAKIYNKSTVSKIIEVVKFIILMSWMLISDSVLYLSKLIRRDIKKVSIMDKFFDILAFTKPKVLNAFKMSKGFTAKHKSKIIKTTAVGTFLLGAVYSNSHLREFFGLIDSNQNRSWFNNIGKKHAFIFSGASIASVIGWKWLKSDFRSGEKIAREKSNKIPENREELEVREEEKSIKMHPNFENLDKLVTIMNKIYSQHPVGLDFYGQIFDAASEAEKLANKIKKDLNSKGSFLDCYFELIEESRKTASSKVEKLENHSEKKAKDQILDGFLRHNNSLYGKYLLSPNNVEIIAELFNHSKSYLKLDIETGDLKKKYEQAGKIVVDFVVASNDEATRAINGKNYDLAIDILQNAICLFSKLSSFDDVLLIETQTEVNRIFNLALSQKSIVENKPATCQVDEKTKE